MIDPMPWIDPWGERQAHPCDCGGECLQPDEHSGVTEFAPRPWTGFPLIDYPVAASVFKWERYGVETPIDGDWK